MQAMIQKSKSPRKDDNGAKSLPFGLDAPFFQAGLAGYSDAAMRLVARRHGCPYCVTEAMLDHFLIQGGKGLKAAELDDADHPIAGQLMGSHPKEIAQGAKILADLGYDTIDINLACPVKKIKKKCRGGHLMQAPGEAIDILDSVRQAVPDHIPTSVKLRRGSDDSAEATSNFHQIFEAVIELGYTLATVHGRTVEQKYIGPSKWDFLRDLVETYKPSPPGRGWVAPSRSEEANRVRAERSDDQAQDNLAALGPHPLVPRHPLPKGDGFYIFGSGDIWEAADIFRMIEETGVDGVSVARGCIGNPWIFTQARALMDGDSDAANTPPTIEQQRDVLLEHFRLSVNLHGEQPAGRMMRKFGIKFSRHHPNQQDVKDAFIKVTTLSDWQAVLDDFYSADTPGTPGAPGTPDSISLQSPHHADRTDR